MRIDRTHILVLNYNGLALLTECLPSIMEAAHCAPVPCRVSVVDNGSTDGSLEWLAREWPCVGLFCCENAALASFNQVLPLMQESAVFLLNNDVKLDRNAVAPLVTALESHPDALFAAPQCWTFDRTQYEGMRTRVRMRYGVIQGVCRVPGFENHIESADTTASAGPALLVHRERFLALRGYDPLYWPGRIEDLDLGYRGWLRGWRGYYVPESLAYHKGFGTFDRELGREQSDRLAARNSMFFAWKNLVGTRLYQHLCWLPVRLVWSILARRPAFFRGFMEAVVRLPDALAARRREHSILTAPARQAAFFKEFSW